MNKQICVYIYIYAHTCVYVYAYVCVCVYIYIYISPGTDATGAWSAPWCSPWCTAWASLSWLGCRGRGRTQRTPWYHVT